MMKRGIELLAVLVFAGLAGCTQPADVDIKHVHGIAHDGEALYLATHNGLAKMVDGSWSYVGDRYDYMGFTQDAGQPGIFYSSGHPNDPYAFGGTHLGLRRSTDGGHTWEQLSLKGEVDFHALTSFANQSLAGYWHPTLMVSRDGGTTWSDHPAPAPVSALAADGGRVTAATTQGLFETTDFSNWTLISHELGTISALAVSDDLVLASTGNGRSGASHRSPDGGITWDPLAPQELQSPQPVVFAFHPDASRVFASTSAGHVMESQDEGQTWQTVREA